jgi:enoyl-CoA hydratase/carnithine racemase
MGGGCGIFFLADIRLASRDTSFSLTEVLRGLVPALISPTIIREWGTSLAREAMLTARPVTAAELNAKGAISVLFGNAEEGERELTAVLQRLGRGGPKALQNAKRLVRTQASTGLTLLPPHDSPSTQAEQSIKAAFVEMMGPSEEALHGIMAFRKSKGKEDVDWYTFYKSKL